MDGQYYGEGVLINYQKCKLYKGKWMNGQLEGEGILKIIDLDRNLENYVMYEGNFHKGQFHDDNGKFYLNIEKTKYDVRKF